MLFLRGSLKMNHTNFDYIAEPRKKYVITPPRQAVAPFRKTNWIIIGIVGLAIYLLMRQKNES